MPEMLIQASTGLLVAATSTLQATYRGQCQARRPSSQALTFLRCTQPCACSYYAQQRAMDAASTSASKDEQKRRQRVQRERQAEFALLDNLAKASCTPCVQ